MYKKYTYTKIVLGHAEFKLDSQLKKNRFKTIYRISARYRFKNIHTPMQFE